MSIKERFTQELRDAMRAKDARRRDVIRQVNTELKIAASAPGYEGGETDELYLEVIASYVKRMQKSIEEYRSVGERGEAMVEKLEFEVDYLSSYLPEKLDEQATRSLVAAAVQELGVEGDPKATGRVIGHIMKSHKDEVDGSLVSRLVREALNG
jgi:uncharacterized protein YqeY